VPPPMNPPNSHRLSIIQAQIALVVGGWLAFRFFSDWPRGLFAAGVGAVPSWAMSLSYIGLCAWMLVAVPVVLLRGKIISRCRTDPIVQAQLLFLAYQTFGLYRSSVAFGFEGLVAGTYILMVCLSFLFVYLLAMTLGESHTCEDVGTSIRRCVRMVFWALVPTMLIAIVQLFTASGKDVGDGIPRIYGATSSPNVLGSLLLVAGAPIFAFASMTRRPRWRIAAFVMFGLLIACFSLAGLACLLGTAGLYWLLRMAQKREFPVSFGWVFGAAIAVLIVMLVAGDLLTARIGSLAESENSFVWRLRTWMDLVEALSNPSILLFGGGLGFDHLGVEYPPHNEYLRVVLETGVIGLLLFVLVLFRVIRGLRAASSSWHGEFRRFSTALQAAAIGLLVWALADSVLRTAPSALLLWFLTGFTMGVARSRLEIRVGGRDISGGLLVPEPLNQSPA
jgi:hypothetical protein